MIQREATIAKFAERLPGWLRQSGVQLEDLPDAVQEAHVEVLEMMRANRGEVVLDEVRMRHELMRIVSRVALRVRRRIQRASDRYLNIDDVDMVNERDEHAQVEARAVVLMALANLDEPTRELVYAYLIEGRTNVEIAQRLQLKEDAAEKRVFYAKQRLRAEIEQLEQKHRGGVHLGMTGVAPLPNAVRHARHGGDRIEGKDRSSRSLWVLGIAIDFSDAFERAMFGATRDVFDAKPAVASSEAQPRSRKTESMVPAGRQWSFVPPYVPTTALMGALTFVPASTPLTPGPASASPSLLVSPAKRLSGILHLPRVDDRESGVVQTQGSISQPATPPSFSKQGSPGPGPASTNKATSNEPGDAAAVPANTSAVNPAGLPRQQLETFLKTNRPEAAH